MVDVHIMLGEEDFDRLDFVKHATGNDNLTYEEYCDELLKTRIWSLYHSIRRESQHA